MTVPIPLLEQNIGQAIRVDESRSGAAHCFLGRSRSRQGVEVCHVRYTEWARRDGREAEGGGLLNRYRAKSSIEGSNPSLSARPL